MNKKNGYEDLLPPDALKHLIKCYWTYENEGDDFNVVVLPDACFDLVLDYEFGVLNNIYFTGVWTEPKELTITKGTRIFAIRFKILAAEIIFDKEIKSLLNSMTEIKRTFWSIDKMKIRNIIDFSNQISRIIQSILDQKNENDLKKKKLFELIYNGNVNRVDELANNVDWSSRQINRYFSSQFGFPLKTFLNIVRCFETFEEVANGNLNPSDNYSDQAHFIREVRKFTNNSPKELFINKNDRYIQLFPLKR